MPPSDTEPDPDLGDSHVGPNSRSPSPIILPSTDPQPRAARIMSITSESTLESIATTRGTSVTNIPSLAPLQAKGPAQEIADFEPIEDDDPASYELLAPATPSPDVYSLERRSLQLFSKEHLQVIFSDPRLLLKFTKFLSKYRPRSVPVLVYYLDALKALRAIAYANAIAEALEPLGGYEFTKSAPQTSTNATLQAKADQAFDVLVREDLAAFITHTYINIVSVSINRRITGTMAPHLREASEGLAEVFCLTDPSKPDNPIVFSSEGFNTTTQYGLKYAVGRNCRFLQGPETSRDSVRRIRDSVAKGIEHQEVFLNYRRDGSPFMNLLTTAPLCDSRGKIRYVIGAQVDVSGLVKDCADLESLQILLQRERRKYNQVNYEKSPEIEAIKKDEFQELSEMLNVSELETIRQHGGRIHSELADHEDSTSVRASNRPRLLIKEPSSDGEHSENSMVRGRLPGVFQHYLLLRPHPSLRILFASPSLRVPNLLQSSFLSRVGGSSRVREELIQAFANGRNVTAKIRWLNRFDGEGRSRWIHCTPLIGINGMVGAWMVLLVDDDQSEPNRRHFRVAPAIDNWSDTRESEYEFDERSGASIAKKKTKESIPLSKSTSNVGTEGYTSVQDLMSSATAGNGQLDGTDHAPVRYAQPHPPLANSPHKFVQRFKRSRDAIKAWPSKERLVASPSRGHDAESIYGSVHGGYSNSGSKQNTRPGSRDGSPTVAYAF